MGRTFSSAGFNIQGKTRVLRKNFRTSNEILSAARNMIAAEEMTSDSEPFYCNQTGIRPILVNCEDREKQNLEILKLVKNLRERFGLSDIAITSRYNKHLEAIKELLENNNIQAELINRTTENYGNETVKLITFHSFKGIESKAVVVTGLTAGEIPYSPLKAKIDRQKSIEERRLLYVAMTRASKMLFLFSHGNPSPFIEDIAPELVKRINPGAASEEYFVEDKEASFYTNLDPKELIEGLEKDNTDQWRQDNRIDNIDRKLYPESKVLSKIVEFIKEHNVFEDDEPERASEEIVAGLLSEFTRKKQENNLLKDKLSQLLTRNNQLLTEKQKVPDYSQLRNDIKSRFPDFDDNLIEMLVNTEFTILSIPNRNSDYFAQYIAYGKIVEILLRKAISIYGIEMRPDEKTLGKIFHKLVSEVPEWKSVLRPLESIGFVSRRNDATHTKRVEYKEIIELRKVLFDRNILFQIGEMVA
jgi:superfamily I DNA/RNA helicase